MRSLSGSLLFGFGGALLVAGLALAIGDTMHATIGGLFAYGIMFGFLSFFLISIGLSLLLESKESS